MWLGLQTGVLIREVSFIQSTLYIREVPLYLFCDLVYHVLDLKPPGCLNALQTNHFQTNLKTVKFGDVGY